MARKTRKTTKMASPKQRLQVVPSDDSDIPPMPKNAPWWALLGERILSKQGLATLLAILLLGSLLFVFNTNQRAMSTRDVQFLKTFEQITREGVETRAVEHEGIRKSIEKSTEVQERMLDHLLQLNENSRKSSAKSKDGK